jgi:hypothetical protein
MRIHKYSIPFDLQEHTLKLPMGAKILYATFQESDFWFWVGVNITANETKRTFKLFPTGMEVDCNFEYIASAQTEYHLNNDRCLVLHLMEKVNEGKCMSNQECYYCKGTGFTYKNEVGCASCLGSGKLALLKDLTFTEKKTHGGENTLFVAKTEFGIITILDRMTGWDDGRRDTETGFTDTHNKFWLASGMFDIREFPDLTIKQAIEKIKSNANTCIGL